MIKHNQICIVNSNICITSCFCFILNWSQLPHSLKKSISALLYCTIMLTNLVSVEMNSQRVVAWLVAIFTVLPGRKNVVGINGRSPVISSYQFLAEVRTARLNCGGVWITTDSVLTAAHCLFVPEKKKWAFRNEVYVIKSNFTTMDSRERSSRYLCQKIIHHKSYNILSDGGLSPFDIAIIKISFELELVGVEIQIL